MPADAPVRQDLNNPAYAAAGKAALEILQRHRIEIGAPAISAAVAVDGEVVWAGTAGWADIKNEIPATPATMFRIGSTSKALTATALARLVDAGMIDLDTPISSYMPDLPNPAWAVVTPRQLASHMAGMPHYGENSDRVGLYRTLTMRTRYARMADALEVFDGSRLLSEPGTAFHYSSFGTVLLGAAMAAAADKTYLEVMRDEVFGPVGMASTIVSPVRGGGDVAVFYKLKDGEARPWRDADLSHRLPGGGFASTSSDLVKMGAAMLDDGYVAPETREAFWTQQVLANGEINEQGYALGWRTREWEIEGVGMVRNANHGGVSRGGQSWLLVFPNHGMALAVNINSNTEEFRDFGRVYEDIARVFIQARPGSG